jgi:hypothetical protein
MDGVFWEWALEALDPDPTRKNGFQDRFYA